MCTLAHVGPLAVATLAQDSESGPVVSNSVSQTPRAHGILQARIFQWVAFPFSRGSSQARDRTQVSHIARGIVQLTHTCGWHCSEGSPSTEVPTRSLVAEGMGCCSRGQRCAPGVATCHERVPALRCEGAWEQQETIWGLAASPDTLPGMQEMAPQGPLAAMFLSKESGRGRQMTGQEVTVMGSW